MDDSYSFSDEIERAIQEYANSAVAEELNISAHTLEQLTSGPPSANFNPKLFNKRCHHFV